MTKANERSTLATTVYEKLRNDLLHGAYGPCEKLRIEAIATEYGVGNNAVREALSRLAAERLVDRHERRGYTAPVMDLAAWQELGRTRCLVECLALRQSMENRTDEWEEAVVVAYHRLARIGRSEDFSERLPEWHIEHRNFHRTLIGNCGSRWIVEFCDQLADQAARYIYIANLNNDNGRDGNIEHEELMTVVLEGTIEEAEKVLTEHYSKTLRAIENMLQADELAGSGA
ncbi:GntR family transcriptional regulator [Tropicimonas sediminicola]|uniref:Transcriptional regulator, GntR family n=1 Tax=Tropicimonas sediminicola TaxID=1031541 RepID=A0A239J9K3_9RHOB|nr:GntR family transcriptional regulator [Tropicimonas sediminicola]SNT02696.1 transcriptional regulator, GntR family [Tropicimonas sediminicola]